MLSRLRLRLGRFALLRYCCPPVYFVLLGREVQKNSEEHKQRNGTGETDIQAILGEQSCQPGQR